MSKKIEKKFDEVFQMLQKDESLLVLYKDSNDSFRYMAKSNSPIDFAAGFATIIDDAYGDDDERAKVLAEAIIDGITAIIKRGEDAGRETVKKLMPAFADAARQALKRLADLAAEVKKDDDEDEDEDCSKCDARFDCPLPNAIKWRKENHVQAPKRKNGKKGHNHAN